MHYFFRGMNAYRELKKEGFDVHIFERDHLPGGVWHYTEEVPLDAPVPNAPIEISDFESSLPPAVWDYLTVKSIRTKQWVLS